MIPRTKFSTGTYSHHLHRLSSCFCRNFDSIMIIDDLHVTCHNVHAYEYANRVDNFLRVELILNPFHLIHHLPPQDLPLAWHSSHFHTSTQHVAIDNTLWVELPWYRLSPPLSTCTFLRHNVESFGDFTNTQFLHVYRADSCSFYNDVPLILERLPHTTVTGLWGKEWTHHSDVICPIIWHSVSRLVLNWRGVREKIGRGTRGSRDLPGTNVYHTSHRRKNNK